ncbi:MAG: glycosyltransferase [Hyphomicrobium sp.]|nr:glycosyltransferase [Hyphomicrobium sp.]
MQILLVHQNFPGQFVHLAPALAARGHNVIALTASTNTNNYPNGISLAKYNWDPPTFDRKTFRLARTYSEMCYRGEIVASAAIELRDRHGVNPDIVFGTPGWGETLFLREIWTEATHILYGEFFYGPRGLDVGFDPELYKGDLAARMAVTSNNAHLLVATHAADKILSPTHWQARSFPDYIRHRVTVIHDGIDTDRVAPAADAVAQVPGTDIVLRKGDEVLTFINRNLEPHRGYHIFMRALPKVMAARPNVRVVIIGGDGISYSLRPPGDKTWKDIFLDEVKDRLDMSRVHFVGKVPYPTFVNLMRVTRVHAYLTYPFVLSWSMLEAMAAGALVVGSRTPPVQELITDGVNGRLVDFFDVGGWSEALIEALAEPARYDACRAAARETIVGQYDLRRICLPRLVEFVEQSGVKPTTLRGVPA